MVLPWHPPSLLISWGGSSRQGLPVPMQEPAPLLIPLQTCPQLRVSAQTGSAFAPQYACANAYTARIMHEQTTGIAISVAGALPSITSPHAFIHLSLALKHHTSARPGSGDGMIMLDMLEEIKTLPSLRRYTLIYTNIGSPCYVCQYCAVHKGRCVSTSRMAMPVTYAVGAWLHN